MSNKFLRGFSLEADEQLPAMPEAAVDEVVEVQQENAEIAQDEAEMQDLEEAIETSEDAANGLENVQEFVEQKQEENGGLTEGEAQAVQVATEALLSRFGGAVKVNMPTMEAFGAANGRAKSTQYTLESIGEKVKEIWEAIKKWVKKWWEKMQDWFNKHFSVAGRMVKQAKALREKLNKKFGTPEEAEWDLTGSERKWLVSAASSDTVDVAALKTLSGTVFKDDSVKALKASNKALLQSVKTLSDASDENAVKAEIDKLANAGKIGNLSATEYENLVKTGSHAFGGTTKLLGAVTKTAEANSIETPAGGGKFIVLGAWVSYKEDGTSDAFGEEKSFKAMDRATMVSAINYCETIAEGLLNSKKLAKQDQEDGKKMLETFEKLSVKLEKKTGDAKTGATAKEALKLVRNAGRIITAAETSTANEVRYATQVCRAWLSYISKCINNLTDQKA